MCVYLSIIPFFQHQTYFFIGFLPPSIQSHTSLQVIHMSHKVYPYAWVLLVCPLIHDNVPILICGNWACFPVDSLPASIQFDATLQCSKFHSRLSYFVITNNTWNNPPLHPPHLNPMVYLRLCLLPCHFEWWIQGI